MYQIQDEKLRVIGYGSRTLTGAECKYHSSKLEFLALKWAICNHFNECLYYAKHFDVFTDFNPLTYLKASCKLNATGQRWINELANYQFSIHYEPGVENPVADPLSRYPLVDKQSLAAYIITSDEQQVRSLFDGAVTQSKDEETWIPLVNTVSTTFDEMENEIIYKAGCKEQTINRNDLLRAQMKGPTIRQMIELKHKKVDQQSDEEKRKKSAEVRALLRHWDKLNGDKDGMLCKTAPDRHQKQVVIPPSFRPLVYSELHVHMGHLGVERVTDLEKDRFLGSIWRGT